MAFFYVSETTSLPDLEEFIEGGGDLSLQDENGDTALMLACESANTDIATRILELPAAQIGLNVQNEFGNTALMIACAGELEFVIYDMLEFTAEELNLGAQNSIKDTALILACTYELEEMSLRMLDFTPEEINLSVQSVNGDTALIMACDRMLDSVALKMLDFTPEQTNLAVQGNNGATALIVACISNLENVAMKILEFTPEENNLHAETNDGQTALEIAEENALIDVVNEIESQIGDVDQSTDTVVASGTGAASPDHASPTPTIKKHRFINITKTIENYDPIMMETEEITIHKYIAESPDNIVFRYGGDGTEYKYFFTKMSYIMNNQDSNILYPCKTASGVIGNNYYLDKPLYNVKGIGLLIDPVYFKTIASHNTNQLFVIEETEETVPSVVSKSVVEGGTWVSSAHCQEGQGTKVNAVYVATPVLEDMVDKVISGEGSSAAASGGGRRRTTRKKSKKSKSKTKRKRKSKSKNKSKRKKTKRKY
jgi:ankyrin repeat protein